MDEGRLNRGGNPPPLSMACPCCALIARYALTGEGEDVNLPKEGGMSNANETRPFDGEASCKPPKSAMCACNPAGVRPKHASSKPSEGYLMVFGEPMTVAIARPPLPKRKTPSTGAWVDVCGHRYSTRISITSHGLKAVLWRQRHE